MTIPLLKIIPDFSTTLASKVAVAATTGSLSTNTDMNGTILATGKYGFTIDRNNSSKEYFTATVTGTSLTNVATVNIVTGVETSGLTKAHRKGAEIIISDFVALKRIQDVLETGYVDTYVPTTDFQIATKAYADGLTIGGSPNADATTKGIVEIATTSEINAGASVGSTGASIVVTPSTLAASKYAIITGQITQYAGAVAPDGWFICDGTAISRTTYANLFSVTSTLYGVGDSSTTFNLPDLRGRVTVGKSIDTEFDTLGETGGEKTHILTVGELAAHNHKIYNSNSSSSSAPLFPYGIAKRQYGSDVLTTSETVGSNTPHNNIQPYQVINYIIKY